MKHIIGVDIGTSSSKAILVNEKGEALDSCHCAYGITEPQPGYRVQDPEVILTAVLDALTQLLQQLPPGTSIGAMGFSAAMHSILAVDEAGKPLTSLITWADSRSTAQADFLTNSGQAGYLYRECGVPIHTMLPLTRIMWWKENEPELYTKARRFISIKEYIIFHLTGEYVVDHSIACSSGLFNLHELTWDDVALGFAGITPGSLSTPVEVTHLMQIKLSPVVAGYNIPADIPLVVGSSDGCLANVGSGVQQETDIAVTIGTSAAVRITSNHTHFTEKQSLFNYLLTPGTFICGGASNNGSILLKWMAESMFNDSGFEDPEHFIDTAMKAPAGSKGLLFLPYLLGERAPVWDAGASGIVSGLRFDHTREDWMRALLEGITMNLKVIINDLLQVSSGVTRIVASGGFTRSEEWVQMLADITNLPVVVNTPEDASGIGAAIIAGYSTGLFSSPSYEPEPPERFYSPNLEAQATYQSNFLKFAELYQRNK
ncbi:gluconate kinase [Segetibacter sp. 3557_3]|uniref:gluconokinase n=1 Tax=Segetibacter sp. 3557_3 TaxID=2547429 RepID=UPI0010588B61|nr:gluconokinase [Segetibacter sp. 3557_3]TDH29007.1 gluconate kinase [Segetibacter sp. 3557_3]